MGNRRPKVHMLRKSDPDPSGYLFSYTLRTGDSTTTPSDVAACFLAQWELAKHKGVTRG